MNAPLWNTSLRLARLRDTLAVLLALAFVLWMTFAAAPGAHSAELLNVSYDPTRELYKDLNAALEVADRLGVSLPLTQQVRQLFVDLADSGREMLDHSALILRLEALSVKR